MSKPTTLFVGLDSHKEFNSVAYAEGGSSGPPLFVGRVGTLATHYRCGKRGDRNQPGLEVSPKRVE